MSHACGRSSAKDKASNVLYRKITHPMKDALTASSVGADCKCGKCRKMKKLRTRKERNQMRDGGKEVSQAIPRHHFSSRSFSKDVSHAHQCCHKTSTTCTFPNVVPVSREPSVITDKCRLLGHHGLFNHEVKSIDIERLLSEQRKLDRNEKLSKNSSFSLCSLAFAADTPSNEKQSLFDSSEETGRVEKKNMPNTKTLNHPQEPENKTMKSNSQCSDLTPGQRPEENHNSSAEMNRNDDYSSAAVSGISEAQSASFENNIESHQTPRSFNKASEIFLPRSVASFVEHTPKNPASATKQAQASHPSPQLPSGPTMAEDSNSLDTQEDSLVSDCTSMSVKAIAANLCNSISFSLLRKRNLVAKTRDTLLKALWQKHGPQLQGNILKIQKHLHSYGTREEQEEVSEPCPIPEFTGEEVLFSADEFTTQCEDTSFATGFSTPSFTKKERLHFDWNATDWTSPHDATADWLGIHAENPIVLDDTFSRQCSPPFPVDFEFNKSFSRESEDLFPRSPFSSCVDGSRSSGHVKDFFIREKGKEFAMSDSTKDYMCFSGTRTLGYRRSPPTSVVNNHYSHSEYSESMHFPQVHNSFETHKYSYGKSFLEEIPYFQQESSFEPSSHLSLPSAVYMSSNNQMNLADYPPSYVLDRNSSLSTGSCFPSPEHWSFHPMRMY